MGHVLARVSGFGWTVLPLFPFRFEHVNGNERALRVERGGATPKVATVSFETGRPRVDLSPGTPNGADVCDLTPSKVAGDFRVETTAFTIGWPADFDIVSTEPGGPSPFDFVRNDGCLVYVQGPLSLARVPKLEAMCAPGQRIVDRGTHATGEWVELVYEHDGRMHWQRHTTVSWGRESMMIVTAQSPEGQAAKTRAAAAFASGTLEPWRG